MDDKQRAQGLKAIQKAAVAADAAYMELRDIESNGCGCPDTVAAAIDQVEAAKVNFAEAHIGIRNAHIIRASREEGAPLPFPEGEEATRAPKGRRKKGGKAAAAGEDAHDEDAA